MIPRTLPLLAALSLSLLVSCRGKPVGEATLHAPGTATARFVARAGQGYVLWADTDGSWTGNKRSRFPAAYTIDVQQGGKSRGKIECDTASGGTSVCGMSTTINRERSADCEIELACALPALSAGEVTLRVQGRLSNPMVVKSVKKMSIIVRER